MGSREPGSTQAGAAGDAAASLLDALPDGIAELGADLHVIVANAALLSLAGDGAPAIVGGRLGDCGFGPGFTGPVEAAILECIATGRAQRLEVGSDRPERHEHLEVSAFPRDRPGMDRTALVVVRDVTERHGSRETLHVREEIEAALGEQMRAFLARTRVPPGSPARIEFITAGVERVLGRTRREMVELRDPAAILHPDDRASFSAPLRAMTGHAGSHTGAVRVRHSDGSDRWLSVRSVSRRTRSGDILIDSVAVDLTERVEAQRALEATLGEIRAIEAQLPGFLFRVACTGPTPADMVLEYASPAMAALLAYPPAELVPPCAALRFIDPTDVAALSTVARTVGSVLATGTPAEMHLECRILMRDGSPLWMRGPVSVRRRDDGTVVVSGFFQDATERRQAEEALRNAEKLEGLRGLAGGIAHDFNNLLTVILGNAELAIHHLPQGSPGAESIHAIVDASHRASELTRQLLVYAGRSRIQVAPVDVSDVIAGIGDHLAASLPPGVTIEMDLAAGLPAVDADPASISRIVLDLVRNGADAYRSDGGTVAVRTSVARLGQRELDRMTLGHVASPGRHVLLEVSDQGAGMDAVAKARMFDPFFSTKADGRGLGLASVLGVVQEHRGTIAVTSAPGRGTTVRVAFPISSGTTSTLRTSGVGWTPGPATRDAGAGGPASDDRERGARRAMVLVVDDEPEVLSLGCRVLGKAGFGVHGVRSGADAVAWMGAQAGETDAVVLDLSMPGMDGEATLSAIRAIVPSIPVVLCTGYDDQATADRFTDSGLSGIVGKPYDAESLVSAVAAALAARPARP